MELTREFVQSSIDMIRKEMAPLSHSDKIHLASAQKILDGNLTHAAFEKILCLLKSMITEGVAHGAIEPSDVIRIMTALASGRMTYRHKDSLVPEVRMHVT